MVIPLLPGQVKLMRGWLCFFFLEKLGEVFDPPEVIDTILVGELFGEIGQMTLFQKAFYLGSLVLFQRRLQLQIVYFTQNIL